MAIRYDDGPEVAASTFPQLDKTSQGPQFNGTTPSQTTAAAFSLMSTKPGDYAYSSHPVSMDTPLVRPREKRVCRMSLPVLALSILVLFLAMSTIGLAAGVSIFAQKYNASNSKLEDAEYASSLLNLTNGCWGYRGSNKTVQYLAKSAKDSLFTMHCNMDLTFHSFIGSYSGSFNNCMETCVIWNAWNKQPSCAGVAYLPQWTDKDIIASSSDAIGDCYLKQGPITASNLTTPRIKYEIDAAILNE